VSYAAFSVSLFGLQAEELSSLILWEMLFEASDVGQSPE
jgi:hypothetical protein